ncbi:MAG: acetolactate synthase small subunit [Actinomycetota bacterium]|nr:acetolactate synthase small subunit [Actinomycetota bacterium]
MARHTLSVLVENKPGVLARVAGLFSRRGFNIHSLAVGPTEHDEISRMTIVVNVEDRPLEQVVKQLNKLINIIKIVELENDAAVERELLLIKVRAAADTRAQIIEIADIFRSKIVDVSPHAVTIEATGAPEKLEALTALLHQYGVKELVRTGLVALARGDKAITERPLRMAERAG